MTAAASWPAQDTEACPALCTFNDHQGCERVTPGHRAHLCTAHRPPLPPGAMLCGPGTPTDLDRAAVADFTLWLRESR